MATSKPISSIGYNTENFLVEKLTSMIKGGIISFYAYIRHNGEMKQDDEAAGKDHWHLLLIPNRCVDLVEVQKEFLEIFPNEPTKPLRFLPFRTSKTEDWVLYALHDPDYLALKGMAKEYVYDVADFKSSDPDMMHTLWIEAKQTLKRNPVSKMRQAARNGVSFGDLVRSGSVSVQQIRNAELFYQYLNSPNDASRAHIYFDDGMLILPNGDVKWDQDIFGEGEV